MYPGIHAKVRPDHPAVVMTSSGLTVTYRQLDDRSRRLARLWWSAGLRPGDTVAVLLDNRPEYFDVLWAALRSGLYLTTLNTYLTADEAAYIIGDSGARALVTSDKLSPVARPAVEPHAECGVRLLLGGTAPGFEHYENALAQSSPDPLPEEPRGDLMLYSSGTTGRPKGIRRPLSGQSVADPPPPAMMLKLLFGFGDDTVYLSPAPLYHTAPLTYCWGVHVHGGTTVVMEKFDPVEALQSIERHGVTDGQWVPTMFKRLLDLPETERSAHDLSSMRSAIHAAAPCPVVIKERMLDWWGPIIHEYYGGTEGNGITYASPDDWLKHKGTVGQAVLGILHICDEEGTEVEVGRTGLVYFEQPTRPFEYHNDPEKTARAEHPLHPNWTTLGDIGHVDDDGFLYLTDRQSFTIISGGVNIYPQEIEDRLILHPSVEDVAVIGVPNDEFGEEVKAVVQLRPGHEPSTELAGGLIDFCRDELAAYKLPRSVDFVDELPRLPTGKLYKRVLREQYASR